MTATAIAHANIALIKYWGKRNVERNLPAVGSISLTLRELYTRTSVTFRDDLDGDVMRLNGAAADPKALQRASRFLDHFRSPAGIDSPAEIVSENTFPTGAGLASSASGFAALTVAAAAAAGLEYNPRKLSELARIGSGSAARSLFGGIVEMHLGEAEDGADSVAEPLYSEEYWPLELLILITSEAAKDIGSTDGMTLTAATSPYYSAWVNAQAHDLDAMRAALAARDFEKLGELSEFSCLKMHALAMSADPGILYWNEHTTALIHEVRALRKRGIAAYFTIDAGPQIKVICPPGGSAAVEAALKDAPGVRRVYRTGLGPDARIVTP